MLVDVKETGFNSKLVRLKELKNQQRSTAGKWFQFQIGAIKRELELPWSPHLNLFQFQIGAIKSRLLSLKVNRGMRFNSKLVRLKEF